MVESVTSSIYAPKGVDTTKLRILVSSSYIGRRERAERKIQKFEDSISRSKKILNFLEEIAGWLPTKVFTVENEEFNVCGLTSTFLFIGDRRWARTPHMLSLYTLLIRLGVFQKFDNFRNQTEFFEACKKIAQRGRAQEENYNQMYSDARSLGNIYQYLYPILKNFQYIFPANLKRRSFEEFWRTRSGIEDLCYNTYRIDDENLTNRLFKVMEKTRTPL